MIADPMEAWKARGRELNAVYMALSRVVRDTIGNRSEGGRYTGDPVEDVEALGAEIQRLRAILDQVITEVVKVDDLMSDATVDRVFRRLNGWGTETTKDQIKAVLWAASSEDAAEWEAAASEGKDEQ